MSEMKVTDRRWWARGEEAAATEEPRLKPSYVEELKARIAAKDLEVHQLLAKFRSASEEFDQARARLRKELSKDVERGRRGHAARHHRRYRQTGLPDWRRSPEARAGRRRGMTPYFPAAT